MIGALDVGKGRVGEPITVVRYHAAFWDTCCPSANTEHLAG